MASFSWKAIKKNAYATWYGISTSWNRSFNKWWNGGSASENSRESYTKPHVFGDMTSNSSTASSAKLPTRAQSTTMPPAAKLTSAFSHSHSDPSFVKKQETLTSVRSPELTVGTPTIQPQSTTGDINTTMNSVH